MSERFEFQTEARQLLDLMIHSIYSNKDIFLRELISNSSDALDKLRIEALRNEAVAMPSEPKISIATDRTERALTIADNGIGMSRDEIIANLGTIARSGTKEFARVLNERRADGEAISADLIGQFGVGFYSAFIVADRVEVLTRRAGEETAWKWESTGDGTYTIEEAMKPEPGTTVTLHLKPAGEDIPDYTDQWMIRGIVKKYSDFVTYPVTMLVESEPTDEEKESGLLNAEGKVVREETLNSMKAIWRRSPSEVDPAEYEEFYHHTFYDPSAPLQTIHLRAEGTSEYYALLFIPSQAPLDLFLPELRHGMQLYVKRVFITDEAKDLMPSWLRFVRGVVDSEDLPLNISREILQQNRAIRGIRNRLTKKTLEMLAEMIAGDREKYGRFWNEFGQVLKEGLFQDPEHQQGILDVSLFASTRGEGMTTLKEYVERMPEEQDAIWFITGDDPAVLAGSPLLDAFRARGYEVLILTDRVDAVWTSNGMEYAGRKLRSVALGDIELGSEDERKEREEDRRKKAQEHGPMLSRLKEVLEPHVKEVRLSKRQMSAPAVVVHDEGDINPQLERLMRAMGQEPPALRRVLELNPAHPLLERLGDLYRANPTDEAVAQYGRLLYGQALLAEGEVPPDPAEFGRLLSELMMKGMKEMSEDPIAAGDTAAPVSVGEEQ